MADEVSQNRTPPDPYTSFRFTIEIGQVISGGFSECAGLNVETEVEEVREGGVNEYTHKLPKNTKYGAITLRRGFIDSDVLWNWHRDVIAGKPQQRKSISILLLDGQGNAKHRWNVTDALPVKWNCSDLKSDGNTILVETLELVHHGFSKA
jgi:phage tail-like protein